MRSRLTALARSTWFAALALKALWPGLATLALLAALARHAGQSIAPVATSDTFRTAFTLRTALADGAGFPTLTAFAGGALQSLRTSLALRATLAHRTRFTAFALRAAIANGADLTTLALRTAVAGRTGFAAHALDTLRTSFAAFTRRALHRRARLKHEQPPRNGLHAADQRQ